MTAAIKMLSRLTDEFFERHMRRAALRISANQHFFPHRVA